MDALSDVREYPMAADIFREMNNLESESSPFTSGKLGKAHSAAT